MRRRVLAMVTAACVLAACLPVQAEDRGTPYRSPGPVSRQGDLSSSDSKMAPERLYGVPRSPVAFPGLRAHLLITDY